MTKVNFYDSINDSMLKFAVIIAFHGILPVLPKDHNAPKRNTAPSCLAFAAPRHSLQNHAEGFHQLHDTSRQTYDAAVLPDAYHHPNGNSETDFAAPLPPAAD